MARQEAYLECHRIAKRAPFGSADGRRPISLRITSSFIVAMPVMFPPGRARLAASPAPTGSFNPVITMGTVLEKLRKLKLC